MCTIDPPVASIGSSTITGQVLRSSGSDSRYGVGRAVSSSRATPTNPTLASGISCCALSTMPRPARSTGTSSGGEASRDPTVSASGVRMCTGVDAALAHGLVDEHQRKVAQSGAETGVVGALVAQRGQPGGGERVIDNADVHAATLEAMEPGALRRTS